MCDRTAKRVASGRVRRYRRHGGREKFWDIAPAVTDGNSNYQQLVFECHLILYGHYRIGCVIQAEGQGDINHRRRSGSGDGLVPAFLYAGRLFYSGDQS